MVNVARHARAKDSIISHRSSNSGCHRQQSEAPGLIYVKSPARFAAPCVVIITAHQKKQCMVSSGPTPAALAGYIAVKGTIVVLPVNAF